MRPGWWLAVGGVLTLAVGCIDNPPQVDCPPGEINVNQECRKLCDSDEHCTHEDEKCINGICLRPGGGCADNSDCGSEYCWQGDCVACWQDAHCDDQNLCTQDKCIDRTFCTHDPISGSCDDSDPCTNDDRCVNGECVGTAPECCHNTDCDDGSVCTSDECGPSQTCVYTPTGRPVYESEASGYHYDYAASGSIVYRVVNEDQTLYLLSAPGVPDKMQDHSSAGLSCDWCGCAIDCAYSDTGLRVSVSATQDPGLVPLHRWVHPADPFRHRSALARPDTDWNEDGLLGYVCPP